MHDEVDSSDNSIKFLMWPYLSLASNGFYQLAGDSEHTCSSLGYEQNGCLYVCLDVFVTVTLMSNITVKLVILLHFLCSLDNGTLIILKVNRKH